MTEKTIRNPSTPGKVKKYLVKFQNGTTKETFGVGATNAWFMSKNIWPDLQISEIKELN